MTQQLNVTESELKVIKSDLKRAKKYLAFLERKRKRKEARQRLLDIEQKWLIRSRLTVDVARLCRRNARC